MTLTPVPKFSVGDAAYVASTTREEYVEKCPDCLGTLKWRVTCPGGEEFDAPCETCRYGYERRGVVSRHRPVAKVQMMTVGSVRVDTYDKHPVSYMMRETGVGSGSIHYEENCFGSRAEAEEAAEKMAQERFGQEYEEAKARRERAREGYLPSPRKELEDEVRDLRFKLQRIEEQKRKRARKAGP